MRFWINLQEGCQNWISVMADDGISKKEKANFELSAY